ncbi:hypothetical protein GW796_00555 [archaeon]|nr:hypothetical protein [archaeon]
MSKFLKMHHSQPQEQNLSTLINHQIREQKNTISQIPFQQIVIQKIENISNNRNLIIANNYLF